MLAAAPLLGVRPTHRTQLTDVAKMRLRFRGACWDDTPTPAMPSAVPTTSASRYRKQLNPSQSLRDIIHTAGLELPPPYVLLRRLQPRAKLSSWSYPGADKQRWDVDSHQKAQLGSDERRAGCEDLTPASDHDLQRVRGRATTTAAVLSVFVVL